MNNMKKRIMDILKVRKYFIALLMAAAVIVVVIGVFLLMEAIGSKGENVNFEIYLVKDIATDKAQQTKLDELPLEETPLITHKDITVYNWENHSFKVRNNGKFSNELLKRSFVVIADGERIYRGTFWSGFYSMWPPEIPVNLDSLNERNNSEIYLTVGRLIINENIPDDILKIISDRRIYHALKELGILYGSATSSENGDTKKAYSNNTTDDNRVKENDLQVHTENEFIPEIDYSRITPIEFLDILKQYPNSIHSVISVPDGWIKYEHVKELVKYVDSQETCARVVSALSSYLPQKTSTVGNEAIFLIEGFLRSKYPPSLHSEGFTDRNAQWYKTGWEDYWKSRINERNTFIYLRSRSNSEIEINEVKKYLGTPTMINTVYDQEELETAVSLMENKTCIWIDREAVEAVDKDWLYKKAVEEKYPVILIGHSSALYSFRDLLSVCRYMHGPQIPEEVIQKNGFSAYLHLSMEQQENSLSVNSILRGFPGSLDVREVVSISNKLLTGCNGLVEKSGMSPEERLRYDYWAMKSNPENDELIEKVLLSLKGINWTRLYKLDSDDLFLIMEWFADRSLHGDEKALKAFLDNREGLDAAFAEGYSGWLTKILRENTEVFIQSLADLNNDDIDKILFYLEYELNGRQVFEKRLKEASENSDFNEKEKEILERLLDHVGR